LYNLYKSNQWNLSHIQNTCNCVFALGYSDTGSLYLGITITVSRKLILCESNKKSNSEILQYGHVAHGERRARAYNEGLGAQPLVGRSGGKAPPLKLKAFFCLGPMRLITRALCTDFRYVDVKLYVNSTLSLNNNKRK